MQSQVDGQLACDAPIVLDVEVQFIGVKIGAAGQEHVAAQRDGETEQHGCDGISRAPG